MVRKKIPEHQEAERAFEQQKAQTELPGLIEQIKAIFGYIIKFDKGGRAVNVHVGDVNNEEWIRACALIVKIRQMVEKGAKIPAENLGGEESSREARDGDLSV